jgi:hypothetical protein
MPYSFLVDYFTNVGDVLDGWGNQFSNVAWGCKTVRRTSKRKFLYLTTDRKLQTGVTNEDFIGCNASYSGYTNEMTRFQRAVWDPQQISILDFRFKVPSTGSLKWLNIAALANIRGLR